MISSFLSRFTEPSTVAKVAAVCYFEWGFVHVFVFVAMGAQCFQKKVSDAYLFCYSIAPKDVVDAYKTTNWPIHAERLLGQHAWNLGVVGFVSACAGLLCWNYTENGQGALHPASWFVGLAPVLADIGYFLAVDVPELGHWSAQLQTYIVSIAGIGFTHLMRLNNDTPENQWWLNAQMAISSVLLPCAIVHKIRSKLNDDSDTKKK